ncbi:MAG: gas vesicle protein K [Thaumarchaeota archaeon]|nr:MAG: gas vesicle protein K [Nitrososphaerota archaeon]
MLRSHINKPKTKGGQKINLEGEKLQKGLAKLVLVILEVLRQILERQAQKRVLSGTLSTQEVERLGLAFMQLKQKVSEISKQLGLNPEELDLTIPSLLSSNNSTSSSLSTTTSLVNLVDKLLDKGAVIGGQVTISVADIDLIALDLLAVLSSNPPPTPHTNMEDKAGAI